MVQVANLTGSLTLESSRFDQRLTKSRNLMRTSGKSMSKSATNMDKAVSSSFRRAAASAAAFEGPLGGIAGRLSGLASIANTTGIALGGALLAVSGLAFAMGKAAKIADDYEGSMNRVEAILKATGNASGQSAEGIREFSEELALGTLASVQGVEAASAKLLTFRRISGDTFRRTLVLAQDLAATGFGSLSDNVTQLGKALEDPIRNLGALTRNGVSFSQAQRGVIESLVATGRAAEAQSIILDAIEKQVGGAGAAEGGAIAKGLDQLSQRIDEFGIALNDASGAGSAFAEIIAEINREIGAVTSAIEFTPAEQLDEAIVKLQELLNVAEQAGNQLSGLEASRAGPGTITETLNQRDAEIEATRTLIRALRDEIQTKEDVAAAAAAQGVAQQELIQAEADAARLAEERAEADEQFIKTFDQKEKAIRSSVEALQIEVNALQAESDALSILGVSLEEAAIARQILTAQQKLGLEASDDEAEVIEFLIRQRERLAQSISMEGDLRKRAERLINDSKTALEKLNEELVELDELRRQGILTEEEYQRALSHTKDEIEELDEASKELERVSEEVSKSLQDGFADIVLGADSADDAIKNLILSFARLALEQATSGIFESLGGGISSIFSGFFADGGRPAPGKLSVVGEEGPELFVPDSAGTIIPNDEIGGGGGLTVFADMRGASVEAVQRLEAFVAEMNGSIEPRAINAVAAESQRNPGMLGAG